MPAIAAVKRLVQPFGGNRKGAICFRSLGRLPMKGTGQHCENQDGGNKED
jgi:hypothetical protein